MPSQGGSARFALVALACVGVDAARAQRIVSINVDEGGSRVPMAATDLAGAPGVRVANWNNFTAGNRTLPAGITSPAAGAYVDSQGAVLDITMSIVLTGPAGYIAANSLINDPRMYSGHYAINCNSPTTSATMSAAFSGVPFAKYDLYVYAQGQNVAGANFRGGSVTLGSTTYYTQGTGSPANDGSGYVEMTTTSIPATPVESDIAFGNYCVFRELTSADVTVTLTSYLWTDYGRMQFYGLQLVELPSAPPCTVLLLH